MEQEKIKKLQEMAKNKKTILEMIQYLIESIGKNKISEITIIAYFNKAFNLAIRDISKIGAWDYFDGGTWSIDKIEKELGLLINEAIKNL